jgi:hypothetical protein
MGKKLLAAFIGGLAIIALIFIGGLLQGGPITACICAIGMLFGGALAVLIYSRMSPIPVRLGEGAMLGALAGLIGSLPLLILLPLVPTMAGDEMRTAIEEQLRQSGQSLSQLPMSLTSLFAMVGVMCAVVTILLALVGGLIGVAIFEKRKPDAGAPPMPPQPPPPPNFGGPPAGGGYGAGT